MKRTVLKVSIMLSTLFLALSVCICLIYIWNIGVSQVNSQETFLLSSQSPDGEYKLEAYKTEPGATVDFSIKVYSIKENRKELIYDAYHEYEAKIYWIDNSIVSINGKRLDLLLGEKYDWRTQ